MIKFLLMLCLISPMSLAQYIVGIDENLVKKEGDTLIPDLTELYRRANLDVSFEIVSGERAVRNANDGIFQALDVRFLNNLSLNNMIAVQEPIYNIHNIKPYNK